MASAGYAAPHAAHGAADVASALAAYIPGDRRSALATGTAIPDRLLGAALLADISGFTALTEVLAQELGAKRGAEVLTTTLNEVFGALITDLERFGGHVIYFSGDGLTCWIDGDDGSAAASCALAMQATMAGRGEVVTPAGASVVLGMKVAVAVGTARRFLVGDPSIQIIDVLAGRMIDTLATGEVLAQRGEVILDEAAIASLGTRVTTGKVRFDGATGRPFASVLGFADAARPSGVPGPEPDLPAAVSRQWVQPAIYERLASGRGEFLAELRSAFPLFVQFGGIDYDHDPAAQGKLDAFVRAAQRILAAYGGSLLHLTIGDKGAYLHAVFGPPLSHEDDGVRAAAAALELRELPSTTAASDIRIGIGYGRLRSGSYGHRRRQTFTCLGDAVNLSARLMASAPAGHILATADARRLGGEGFDWRPLAPLVVKGKSEPVAIFELTGLRRAAMRSAARRDLPLVGRHDERARLAAAWERALEQRGGIAGVSGEAGIGKSRLVGELLEFAQQSGAVVASGECPSYGTKTSYFVWRAVWSTLLGIDEGTPDAERIAALQATIDAIDPALAPRVPLLRDLLGLPIEDSALTASFDAKLRKTSLEGLLADCLRAKARDASILIVLDDCQWIDPLSRELVEWFGRSIAEQRVLVVMTYRPDAGAKQGLFASLPHFEEIVLGELGTDDAAVLVRECLTRRAAAGAPFSATLVERLTTRSQGNPFYIEELVDFLVEQRLDLEDPSVAARLELPDSLDSLIVSRIDMLDEEPREALKIASVLGRSFSLRMLASCYPEFGTADAVASRLAMLEAGDLIKAVPDGDGQYHFNHVVTQEVAYQTLPFAFRSMLHDRVGAWIESGAPGPVERNLDLLAYHYGLTDNRLKKRIYLGRAGDAAEAAYANLAAIDYFERLVALEEGRAQVEVMGKLGRVHELVGNWTRAREVHEQALELAGKLGDEQSRGSAEVSLAEVARKQQRYDEAEALLANASGRFAALADEPGLAKALHLQGTIAAQRGDYGLARDRYQRSLSIRERSEDKEAMAGLLSNLGILAEYDGDYAASRAFHERALALRTEAGDRRGISNSMNNLGMIATLERHYEAARDWFGKSIALCEEIGEPWMIAICHNNLGNAMRGLGDPPAARHHYLQALDAYRVYDDRWALSFLLEDIGMLAAQDGDARRALELVGAADAARLAIGAPRAPSLEQEIEDYLGPAVAKLSADEALAWRTLGRSLPLTVALDRARASCLAGAAPGPVAKR